METLVENLILAGKLVSPSERTEEERIADFVSRANAAEAAKKEEGYRCVEVYDCPICKNKMYELTVRKDGGIPVPVAVPCRCIELRKNLTRLEKSGLGDKISECTFEKFDATEGWQKTVKNAAVAFSQKPEGWFFIGGASGSGKTHLCTAICKTLIDKGKEVKYMLWRDEATRLKAMVNDTEAYEREMRFLKNVDVLYIDDFFKTGNVNGTRQLPTAADVNLAYELLNYRYNQKNTVTLITSECDVDDITAIDEAIGGRIIEKAAYVLNISKTGNKNYRMRKVMNL